MDSYTAIVEFQNDDMENILLIKLLVNENTFVQFEFESIHSIEEWNEFIEHYQNIDSANEKEFIFQDGNGTTSIISRGQYVDFHVSDYGHGVGGLTISVKKNQSLFDAFNQIVTLVQEN